MVKETYWGSREDKARQEERQRIAEEIEKYFTKVDPYIVDDEVIADILKIVRKP